MKQTRDRPDTSRNLGTIKFHVRLITVESTKGAMNGLLSKKEKFWLSVAVAAMFAVTLAVL